MWRNIISMAGLKGIPDEKLRLKRASAVRKELLQRKRAWDRRRQKQAEQDKDVLRRLRARGSKAISEEILCCQVGGKTT